MRECLSLVLGLAVLAVVVAAGILAVAVAETWTAATTNNVIVAAASICGGGMVAVGMALGLAVGIRIVADRRRTDAAPPMYDGNGVRYNGAVLDPYRRAQLERLQMQTARDALRLEQERRQLAAPSQPDAWTVPASWELVDGDEPAEMWQ